jgi:hypothetical protein
MSTVSNSVQKLKMLPMKSKTNGLRNNVLTKKEL